jgi:hypothetical protein
MICLEQKSLHNVSKSEVLSLVALLSRDCKFVMQQQPWLIDDLVFSLMFVV